MHNNQYVGLFVPGVNGLGSVTPRIARYAIDRHADLFLTVEEVKVVNRRQHWGGIVEHLTKGKKHRQTITPDVNFFDAQQHPHRFLLRECSRGLGGHYIIQTKVDEFWDPNQINGGPSPLIQVIQDNPGLSLRAGACLFDVL